MADSSSLSSTSYSSFSIPNISTLVSIKLTETNYLLWPIPCSSNIMFPWPLPGLLRDSHLNPSITRGLEAKWGITDLKSSRLFCTRVAIIRRSYYFILSVLTRYQKKNELRAIARDIALAYRNSKVETWLPFTLIPGNGKEWTFAGIHFQINNRRIPLLKQEDSLEVIRGKKLCSTSEDENW